MGHRSNEVKTHDPNLRLHLQFRRRQLPRNRPLGSSSGALVELYLGKIAKPANSTGQIRSNILSFEFFLLIKLSPFGGTLSFN